MVYNPGGQLGKDVMRAGQRPAKDPRGPFLGKAAKSRNGSSQTGARKNGRNVAGQKRRPSLGPDA